MGDGIVTHLARTPVDPELAARQHAAYVAALAARGWAIREAPAGRRAARLRVHRGHDGGRATASPCSRGPARRSAGRGRRRRGRRCASSGSTIARIEEPGTLDGGDVLQVGDTVYVGRGGRTNGEGIRQLRAHLGRTAPSSRSRSSGVLHLKSAVTALPDGTIVCADRLGCSTPSPLPPRAHRPRGGRRPRRAARRGPRADGGVGAAHRGAVRRLGFDVDVVDIGEFERMEGCVTCLSVLIPYGG